VSWSVFLGSVLPLVTIILLIATVVAIVAAIRMYKLRRRYGYQPVGGEHHRDPDNGHDHDPPQDQ